MSASPSTTSLPVGPAGALPVSQSVLLHGEIRWALLWLALPVLGEQALNSCVAVFDTFLAGRISRDATSAVGLAAYVDWLASMLFALVATGTTALVSRSVGAGKQADANRFANQSLLMAAISGVAVSVLLYSLAPTFARLQAMDGATYEIAVQYLRTTSLAMTATGVTLVGAAALRGAGDTRTPMLVFAALNAVNVVVSASLVFGWAGLPEYGVRGIVLGTVVARVFGACVMCIVFLRGCSGLRFHTADLRLDAEPARRVLRIGAPAAVDGAVMWAGHFMFLMIIARLGGEGVRQAYYAAHIVGVRLEAFTYLPAVAWAAAAATMIGQNLGAQQPDRSRRAGHEAALQCGLLATIIGVTFVCFAEQLFALMSRDELVRQVGAGPFRLVACFQPALAASIVYVGALRGAGDTRYPMLFTLIGVGCVRLPMAYLLGDIMGLGLLGAWIAMCGDFTLRFALALLRFVRGRWMHIAA